MITSAVICPLDGSPNAERAATSAADAAALLDQPLVLFSAVEDQHMVDRRTDYLQTVASSLSGTNAPNVSEIGIDVCVDPHPLRALSGLVDSPNVQSVMATSSRPLLHTGYIGSAAERVARDAQRPALLVGPHATVRLGEVERVVVPCDGSQLSETAIIDGVDWARRLGIDLWLVSCISPSDQRQAGYSPDAEANYVRRIANQTGAEWDVLHGADPAKAIAGWAGPSLIAMTTHGRSGISRLRFGSVTVGVTRWSSGPVLVSNGHLVGRSKGDV